MKAKRKRKGRQRWWWSTERGEDPFLHVYGESSRLFINRDYACPTAPLSSLRSTHLQSSQTFVIYSDRSISNSTRWWPRKHIFCAFAVPDALLGFVFRNASLFLHPRKPTSPPVNYTYWRPDLKVVQRFCRSRTSVPRTFSTRGRRSYNAYIIPWLLQPWLTRPSVTPSVRHTHGANLPLLASTLVSSVNVFRIISNKRQ